MKMVGKPSKDRSLPQFKLEKSLFEKSPLETLLGTCSPLGARVSRPQRVPLCGDQVRIPASPAGAIVRLLKKDIIIVD